MAAVLNGLNYPVLVTSSVHRACPVCVGRMIFTTLTMFFVTDDHKY